MKATPYFLTGILLGTVIGWALGFLRIPYAERNISFLLGFITALAVVLLSLALALTRNERSLLARFSRKNSGEEQSGKTFRSYFFFWMLLATVVVAGGLFTSFIFYRQNQLLKAQLNESNRKIQEQSELIESGRNSNLALLMDNLLEKADRELRATGRISDTIIAGMAALSSSLKPYRLWQGDSLSVREVSPERGQLLLSLLLMKMDVTQWGRIKERISFSGAELKGANLQGANLSGADLRAADLRDADLHGANLNHADLKDAQLWGSNLNAANLRSADLKRANLSWAKLNEADLNKADLNGARMTSAQLMMADLRGATVQWADLKGALLREANLAGADLMGTALDKVNLTQANLFRTNLRMVTLTDANLKGVELDRAVVDSNWVSNLSAWRLTEANEIKHSFRLLSDTLDQWKHPMYRLQRIKSTPPGE